MPVKHPVAVPPAAMSLDVSPGTKRMVLLACDSVSSGDRHHLSLLRRLCLGSISEDPVTTFAASERLRAGGGLPGLDDVPASTKLVPPAVRK